MYWFRREDEGLDWDNSKVKEERREIRFSVNRSYLIFYYVLVIFLSRWELILR